MSSPPLLSSHSSASAPTRNPNLGALGPYGHYVPTAATSGLVPGGGGGAGGYGAGPPPLTGVVNEVPQRYIGGENKFALNRSRKGSRSIIQLNRKKYPRYK